MNHISQSSSSCGKRINPARAGILLLVSLATALSPTKTWAADKAAVLLPGSINDQSWNAQGYAGLLKLKELGWDTAYSENVQPADMAEALRDYAKRGYTLIIGHTGRFLSPMELVGPKFPKTTFIVGSGNAGSGKNVASIDFDNTQFGYLIGVGRQDEQNRKDRFGQWTRGVAQCRRPGWRLPEGSKNVNPSIEIKVIYVQDMEDAAAAKEAALSLIAWGRTT